MKLKHIMKDQQYSNFLKDKKVVIIGPAQYLTTKSFNDFGEKIDNDFDVVVRLNRGMELIENYSSNIGTRTDVLYNCLIEHKDNGGLIDINNIKNNNIEWVCTIPNSDMTGKCYNNDLHSMVNPDTVNLIKQNFNFHVMDFTLYGELNKNVNCRSNTGYAAIFDVLYHDVKSLFITGFSFYLDAFAPGYKEGCSRDEDIFAKDCFTSKRHNQLNQWNYARSALKNNLRVDFDPVLTKILSQESLNREEYNKQNENLYTD